MSNATTMTHHAATSRAAVSQGASRCSEFALTIAFPDRCGGADPGPVSTKPGSKVDASVQGRGRLTELVFTIRPGRELMT